MKQVFMVTMLIAAVLGGSMLSGRLWAADKHAADSGELTVEMTMTVAQFGQANALPNPMLKKLFDLQSKQDMQKPLAAFGMSEQQIRSKASAMRALAAEHGRKNWKKIFVKFGLWAAWLAVMLTLLRKGRVTAANRAWLLLVPVVLFGVVLGADPNPMGTVKDAIVLYAKEGVIFPPRLIALAVFLLLVIAANKLICAWGCQFGTLQDLLFQLMHGRMGQSKIKPLKLPFALTNTIRILFLAAVTAVVFRMGTDMVEAIDPFKIFKPQALGWIGAGFVALMLLASLLIYRPWCHLFCPFGLVGWLAEKISLFRVRIDRSSCTNCKACVKACPSRVMGDYLDRKSLPADCFSCGLCIETCPEKAIRYTAKKSADKKLPTT